MKCSVFGGHGHSHGVSGPCHSHGGQDAHSAAAVPLARDAHAPSQVCSQNRDAESGVSPGAESGV